MKRLEWISRELLIVGVLALAIQLADKAIGQQRIEAAKVRVAPAEPQWWTLTDPPTERPGEWTRQPVPPQPSNWNAPVYQWAYVDRTVLVATDDRNPYGSPAKPRLSLPSPADIRPGTVIVLVGEFGLRPGDVPQGEINIAYHGSYTEPVIIDATRATFRRTVAFSGRYTVLHGGVVRSWSESANPGIRVAGMHLCVRKVEVTGGPKRATSGISIGGSSYITIRDCYIHRNGTQPPWTDTRDEDHHGIGVGAYASNVWIIGCTLTRNSGDGVQINGGQNGYALAWNIVVANCLSFENKQAGLWAKQSSNVRFLGNICRMARPSGSSPMGAGIGFQYGPIDLWIIGCTIEYCSTGVFGGSRAPGEQLRLRIERNIIRDIHAPPGSAAPPWGPGSAVCIYDVTPDAVVRGNTIERVDARVSLPRGANGAEIQP